MCVCECVCISHWSHWFPLHILFRGGGRFDPLCLMKVLQRGCRIWSLMKISSGRTSGRERMCSITFNSHLYPVSLPSPFESSCCFKFSYWFKSTSNVGMGPNPRPSKQKNQTHICSFLYIWTRHFPIFPMWIYLGGLESTCLWPLQTRDRMRPMNLLQEGLYIIYIYTYTAGSDGSSSNHQPSSTYDPARSASLPSPTPCCPSCESISSKKRMEGTRARAWKDSGFWSCEFSEWPSGNPTLESETQGKSFFFPLLDGNMEVALGSSVASQKEQRKLEGSSVYSNYGSYGLQVPQMEWSYLERNILTKQFKRGFSSTKYLKICWRLFFKGLPSANTIWLWKIIF